MNKLLKQSTASQSRALGPFVDDTELSLAARVLRSSRIPARRRAELRPLMVAVRPDEHLAAGSTRFRRLATPPVAVERAERVMRCVLGSQHRADILGAIVGPVLIPVMNDFALPQRTPDLLARDKSVLQHIPARHRVRVVRSQNHHVAVRRGDASALPVRIGSTTRAMAPQIPNVLAAPQAPRSRPTWREFLAAPASTKHEGNIAVVQDNGNRP